MIPLEKSATLFCRVSSSRQATQGHSPETQQRLGEEYAKRHGLTITRVFQAVETASKKLERTQWEKFLVYVKSCPERHVLVASVDRALRNFHDLPEVSDLQKKYGKTVHFFLEGLILDGTQAPSDELRLGMSAALATYFARDLSQKVRRGIEQKVLRGEWPSRAMFGYLNHPKTRRLAPDPQNAHWVRRIKELAAEHRYSLDRIVAILKDEGKALTRSHVEATIRNPIYAGRFEWPKGSGNMIEAVHEPLVSWHLHQMAVAGLTRPGGARNRKHEFVFAGMIRCGSCSPGRAVVFQTQKGKFVYGHCTGTRRLLIGGTRVPACPNAVYVPLKTIEDQVLAMLESFHMSEERAAEILADLTRDAGKTQSAIETQVALLKGQLARLSKRIERAYEDHLEGKIDAEFWAEQQRKWKLEKMRLEDALRRQEDVGPSAFLPNIRKVLELSKKIVPLYKSANPAEKRVLLNFVCLNLRLTGKKLDYKMRTPFAEIAEGRTSGKWWAVQDAIRTWAASAVGAPIPTRTELQS